MAKFGAGLNPARRKAAFAKGTDKTKGAPKSGLLGGLGPARSGFRGAAPTAMPGLPKMPGMPGPKKGGW
jgi:hypothetical protein